MGLWLRHSLRCRGAALPRCSTRVVRVPAAAFVSTTPTTNLTNGVVSAAPTAQPRQQPHAWSLLQARRKTILPRRTAQIRCLSSGTGGDDDDNNNKKKGGKVDIDDVFGSLDFDIEDFERSYAKAMEKQGEDGEEAEEDDDDDGALARQLFGGGDDDDEEAAADEASSSSPPPEKIMSFDSTTALDDDDTWLRDSSGASKSDFFAGMQTDDDTTAELLAEDPHKVERRRNIKAKLELKREMENKKGRGWSDAMDMEECFMRNQNIEDMPMWTPRDVSQVSQQRVQIFAYEEAPQPQNDSHDGNNNNNGASSEEQDDDKKRVVSKIPTLDQLARLPLPPPVHPHPGNKPKAYALHRKRHLEQHVATRVRELAASQVRAIQGLATWDEKQEAVDVLFESVEAELKRQEDEILGRHPQFGIWVEKALEAYLQEVDAATQASAYESVAVAVQNQKVAPKMDSLAATTLQGTHGTIEAAVIKLYNGVLELSPQQQQQQQQQHVLFRPWAVRALDEFVQQRRQDAANALVEQVVAAVQANADLMDQLLAVVQQRHKTRGEKEAAVDKLVQESAVLSELLLDGKQYTFYTWLQQALDEHQYGLLQALAKERQQEQGISDEHIEDMDTRIQYRTKLLHQQLEQEHHPLIAIPAKYEAWMRRLVLTAAGESADRPAEVPAPAETDGAMAVPADLLQRALMQVVQTLEKTKVDDNSVVLGPFPTAEQDKAAVPIFMDCYGPGCNADNDVPDILRPLKFVNDRVSRNGRMLEEWELAAHKETKRIMLRHCTRQVARILERSSTTHHYEPQRVLLHGARGVGKTAVLASIVASARQSGHIVHYLPHGRMLHEFGYYNVPSKTRPTLFDLPTLAQIECQILLDTHRKDLEGMRADKETMARYYTERRISLFYPEDSQDDSKSLIELLELGAEKELASSASFGCVMEVLMTQEEKPFTIVVDEFNLFFTPGKYFNMEHDFHVQKPIPYQNLTLFKPMMNAMALSARHDGEEILRPKLMKRGAIIAATSESHDVSKPVSVALMENARRAAALDESPLQVIEVPRWSKLEVEHILANYETVGMGKLRFDNGATVNNPQEVEYLRMVSSSNPLKLLNASIIP